MTKGIDPIMLDFYEDACHAGTVTVKVEVGDLRQLIAAARELEGRKILAEEELVPLLTGAMRSADRAFERVGGSTRHHVRDCLIPELERLGLGVVRITSPSEPTDGR